MPASAGLFLYGNAVTAKPGSTPAAVPTPTAASSATPASSAPLHALFAGRSSGDQVTVAIAINGKKAAADLNAGLASEVSLQGSVSGGLVTLTSSSGTRLAGSVSGADMFGTVTGFLGQSFPFSAAQAAVQAVYAGRSSNGEVTLAVSTDGDKAVAYVCNGHTIEAWLQGSVKGSQVNLAGNKGASLTGSLSGLAMFGMVTPSAGLSLPFSAELSPHPAGVFQARITVNGLATRIGWAVLPDGIRAGSRSCSPCRSSSTPVRARVPDVLGASARALRARLHLLRSVRCEDAHPG
ncbi:MAG: hypothetical protein ACRDPY_31900 [Streptosporangiaceae bacterium]